MANSRAPSGSLDAAESALAHGCFQLVKNSSAISASDRAKLVNYLARRCGDHAKAEDLVQDATIKLVAFMQREPVKNPKALIFRIAENLLVNDFHRTRRRPTIEIDGELVDQLPSIENQLMHRERLELVQSIIARMPRKRREVFIRRRIHGQKHQEIAAEMNLSMASVEKHIVRAMTTLRAELEREALREAGK